MEARITDHMKLSTLCACIVLATAAFVVNDARLYPEQLLKKSEANFKSPSESTNGEQYGLASPLYLPPSESPLPSWLDSPPSCSTLPFSQPSRQSPTIYALPPPPSPVSNFPVESPPKSTPNNSASPPTYTHWPPSIAPSPPIHQSPVGFVPPPPHRKSEFAVWCVAKPTVPDSIIQDALDYACGSGADCKSIQPNGPCFQPDTLVAHASYAFNSYWQKTKVGGGTCDFGGTAMLVTVDPSFNNCYFIFN